MFRALSGTRLAYQVGPAASLFLGWLPAMLLLWASGWLAQSPSLGDALWFLPHWVILTAPFADALRNRGPRWTLILLVVMGAGGCIVLLEWMLWGPWTAVTDH